jgi:hypothetical protein
MGDLAKIKAGRRVGRRSCAALVDCSACSCGHSRGNIQTVVWGILTTTDQGHAFCMLHLH